MTADLRRTTRDTHCRIDGVVMLDPRQMWHCPACGQEHLSREARPHTPFHACAALGGLSAPYIAAGQRGEHRVIEREDYVGGELVRLVDGRPVMSIVTVRDDGQDCTVFAPTATASAEGRMA